MSPFIKGAFWLLISGLIVKILGLLQRILTARIIGEESMGFYMMVFPTFVLLISITQLGLPIAVARFIALATAKKDEELEKRIITTAWLIAVFMATLITPTYIWLVPFITSLFQEPEFMPLFYSMAPVIPIVAVSAVLKGICIGKENMKGLALSQITEQVVRITSLVIWLPLLLPTQSVYLATAAMITTILGEAACCMVLFLSLRRQSIPKKMNPLFRSPIQKLLGIALPTTGTKLIGTLSWFLEPIIMSYCMQLVGYPLHQMNREYGILTGYVIPILLLPTFFTLPLSHILLPEVSHSLAKNQSYAIEKRLDQSIRYSLLIGVFTMSLFFQYGEYFMEWIYGNQNGTDYLYWLCPFFIFYFLQSPLIAFLQAIDHSRSVIQNSFIGAAVKGCLIYVFIVFTPMRMQAIALAMILGMLIVSFLYLYAVRAWMKKGIQSIVKIIILGVISFLTLPLIDSYVSIFVHPLFSIPLYFICFILLSFKLGVLLPVELRRFIHTITFLFKKKYTIGRS